MAEGRLRDLYFMGTVNDDFPKKDLERLGQKLDADHLVYHQR